MIMTRSNIWSTLYARLDLNVIHEDDGEHSDFEHVQLDHEQISSHGQNQILTRAYTWPRSFPNPLYHVPELVRNYSDLDAAYTFISPILEYHHLNSSPSSSSSTNDSCATKDIMNDVEPGVVKLAELLRSPDDLDNISALKAEFTRKKAQVDSQLRIGLQEQLGVTQAGMSSMIEGQRTVDLIKAEMQKIDRLCAEAQNMIRDFPHINTVAQTHRNFAQVEEMRRNIEGFDAQLSVIEQMLSEDDREMDVQPNLLAIHYQLSKLRDIKDVTLHQIKNSGEAGEELVNNLPLRSGSTLSDYFSRLDGAVEWFDMHVGRACMGLIDLVQSGNDGLITRLALVIHEEEKNDKKARALQDAQHEFKELAARFKSITTGKKEIRGYKEKFLQAIEIPAAEKFEETKQEFVQDPDKLEKSVRWYFNDLNTVKLGLEGLMPKRWKIFQTYVQIYHKQMHDWLVAAIEDPNTTPTQLLAIVNWSDKYYVKTKKLGVPDDWMRPHVIDDKASEVVREYRSLIIRAVNEWMERMGQTDSQTFRNREENAHDHDENGFLRSKTLADMWRMIREQLEVAKSSERTDIVEGVVDAMFRSLQARQRMWEQLIDSELQAYLDPTNVVDSSGLGAFQDHLVAIANDQIACIDDADDRDESTLSYLTRFSTDIQPVISLDYAATASTQIETLRDGYVDLSTHCLTIFAQLVVAVDFKPLVPEFFTRDWYVKKGMGQAVSTFEDYLTDYAPVLHPSLRDILAEEFADELLIRYLSSVRNKGAKFKRNDPVMDKLRDDLTTVFSFFEKFDGIFDSVRQKWRVCESFLNLVLEEKAVIPDVYEAFKTEYWDLGMSWVESVLRARDDFDRSLLNNVKAKAAGMEIMRGPETIMGKIK